MAASPSGLAHVNDERKHPHTFLIHFLFTNLSIDGLLCYRNIKMESADLLPTVFDLRTPAFARLLYTQLLFRSTGFVKKGLRRQDVVLESRMARAIGDQRSCSIVIPRDTVEGRVEDIRREL